MTDLFDYPDSGWISQSKQDLGNLILSMHERACELGIDASIFSDTFLLFRGISIQFIPHEYPGCRLEVTIANKDSIDPRFKILWAIYAKLGLIWDGPFQTEILRGATLLEIVPEMEGVVEIRTKNGTEIQDGVLADENNAEESGVVENDPDPHLEPHAAHTRAVKDDIKAAFNEYSRKQGEITKEGFCKKLIYEMAFYVPGKTQTQVLKDFEDDWKLTGKVKKFLPGKIFVKNYVSPSRLGIWLKEKTKASTRE